MVLKEPSYLPPCFPGASQAARLELRQQISGSGFIYSDGSTVVRGKGDELTVEAGRMAPVRCVAR
ncbi:MAG: MliC family protein [Bacillota bacterium]